MSSIDDVLERLVNDPGFRDQLTDDPAAALHGYDLTHDDIEVLAASFSSDAGVEGGLEARRSKSALIGTLSQVLDTLGIVSSSRVDDPGGEAAAREGSGRTAG